MDPTGFANSTAGEALNDEQTDYAFLIWDYIH